MASCALGELIPCAFVWHDPGITPCCKSLFAPLIAIFSSYRRGFRVNMWGTSSPGDKLTGDFGNRPDATSISDRGLFCLLAGNFSLGVFRLFQNNRAQNGASETISLFSPFRGARLATARTRSPEAAGSASVRSQNFRLWHIASVRCNASPTVAI